VERALRDAHHPQVADEQLATCTEDASRDLCVMVEELPSFTRSGARSSGYRSNGARLRGMNAMWLEVSRRPRCAAPLRCSPMSSRADVERSHDSSLLVGPLLRYADETSATIWAETGRGCSVEIAIGDESFSASTWSVHDHHYALVRIERLAPCSANEYSVTLNGRHVWPSPASEFRPSVIRDRVRVVGLGVLDDPRQRLSR
jgi:hypothetical protein